VCPDRVWRTFYRPARDRVQQPSLQWATRGIVKRFILSPPPRIDAATTLRRWRFGPAVVAQATSTTKGTVVMSPWWLNWAQIL
jgi:hypothetical protein